LQLTDTNSGVIFEKHHTTCMQKTTEVLALSCSDVSELKCWTCSNCSRSIYFNTKWQRH